MKTLSEFLNKEKNQEVVLEKIIGALREKGEWGRHGLFARIAEAVKFSQSYVSKTLKGKMPLRENFLQEMAEYLGVSVAWLRGEVPARSIGQDEVVMGKTPERVVELIRTAVAEKSQSAVARESGLALLTVQRYLKGIGEPRIESLQKLANYFGETFIIEVRPEVNQPDTDQSG